MIKKTVTIDSIQYDFEISEHGLPCLLLGSIYPLLRSLSEPVQGHFQLISSDLYWVNIKEQVDFKAYTMDRFVKDIENIRKQLSFEKIFLMAHSAFGFLALEYALQYPQSTLGVIAIATPPYWNPKARAISQSFYDEDATESCKMQITQANEELQRIDKHDVSPSEFYIAQYFANGAKFWHRYTESCKVVWENVEVNLPLADRFIVDLLNDYDRTSAYTALKCPVFVAVGRYDYAVCYKLWGDCHEDLKVAGVCLTVNVFEESAHYPMSEEPKIFEFHMRNWLNCFDFTDGARAIPRNSK